MAFEGGRVIRERVARNGIDCDLKDGGVFAASNASSCATFAALLSLKAPDTMGALRTRQPSYLPKAGAPGIVCPLEPVAAHTLAQPKTGPGNRAPRALVTG